MTKLITASQAANFPTPNIGIRVRKRGIFDFDDTVLITGAISLPVFYRGFYRYLLDIELPKLDKAIYDRACRTLNASLCDMAWEEFEQHSTTLRTSSGNHLNGWQKLLEREVGWSNETFRHFAADITAALMADGVLEEGVLAGLEGLRDDGFELIIGTHNHLDVCMPLLERFGLPFTEAEVYDSLRMQGVSKETPAWYERIRKERGEVDKELMADDAILNLATLRNVTFPVRSYFIHPEDPDDAHQHLYDHHFTSLAPALIDMRAWGK